MLSVEERIDQREIWELAREELRKLQTRFADQQTFGVEELLKEVAREAGLHPHEIELDSSEFEVLTHRVLEVIEDSHSNNHAPYLLPPKVAAALLREPQVPEGETSAVVPIDENIQLADKLARWAIDQESVRWEVEKLEGPLYLVHNLFERIKDQRASFEWNGHWHDGRQLRDMDEFLLRVSCSLRGPEIGDDYHVLKNALKDNQQLDRFVRIGHVPEEVRCCSCDESFLLETDGKTVRAVDPCLYPKGHWPLEIELNIPSGRIVLSNDLREWFDILGEYDISEFGHAMSIRKYAEIGSAFCPVDGDISAGVYQQGTNELSISGIPSTDTYDFSTQRDVKVPKEEVAAQTVSGEFRGEILRQIPYWSGVDYHEFRRRFNGTDRKFSRELKRLGAIVVDVEPGVYKVTHLPMEHYKLHDASKPYHYSTLERVREPDSVEDFDAKLDVNLTAGQVLFDVIRTFPTLYLRREKMFKEPRNASEELKAVRGDEERVRLLERSLSLMDLWSQRSEQERVVSEAEFAREWKDLSEPERIRSVALAADSVLQYTRNLHKNGWCGGSPDLCENSPAIDIPQLHGAFRFFHMNLGLGVISDAAGMDRPHKGSKEVQLAENGLKFIERPPVYLNQSFRELAFNILQCIIRYGVKIDEKDQEHFDVEEAGMRAKQFAEVALQRLARMYPDDIPQYCRELVR